MIAQHDAPTADEFITVQEIENAVAYADAADAKVARSWEEVEDATKHALALEAHADH
jgi:hypothetical protein